MKLALKTVDKTKYPDLSNYTKAEIWREIGPGGLYLVSLLAKQLRLEPGAWVLDLGCGSAESSLFLADHYQVKVIAADLWADLDENAAKIEHRGHRGSVIPLKLDASQPLPFSEGYFDAILCINNLNFYGTDLKVVDGIARHLKRGGIFCSGGECLNEEFTPEQIDNPPAVYNFHETAWEADFLTTHSPGWWAEHIGRSEELHLESCRELEDGRLYFEEQALLTPPQGYFGLTPKQARRLEMQQIEYGRRKRPYMTIYQLVAERKKAAASISS
jgi:SAM-dependent methyltransferase